jgi:hypothetical protein
MKTLDEIKLKCVSFYYKGAPNSDVYVSGSFNHWNSKANKTTDSSGMGDYYVSHMLPLGRHEYKFVVNGEYKVDPENPHSMGNDFGTLNSIIHVE